MRLEIGILSFSIVALAISGGTAARAVKAETPTAPHAASSLSGAKDTREAFLESVRLDELWSGDLDGIIERRRLRVLTTYSRTNYFLDGGRPRGITYEAIEELLKDLNAEFRLRRRPIRTVYIPLRRDEILEALLAGRGDLAAASLTITNLRAQRVDFTIPLNRNATEVVVTGPSAPRIDALEDLSGVEVWVRPSSSYHESLVSLNRRFESEGRAPVVIVPAPELLETEDLLEIVNAGTMGVTIADSDIAEFWADIFKKLVVHDDLVTRDDVRIGWAVQAGHPQLLAKLNEFVKKHREGTLFGNILLRRYLRNNVWVKNPRAEQARERLRGMVELFKKYGSQYDLDWILIAAQAYQESGLDQSKVSAAGAIGVMQILPSTAASHEVRIPDIQDLENNIHAGIKYLRVLHDHYFDAPGMSDLNRMLFSFAGYNAGPNRIQRLRRLAESRGLDPNEWFENVEVVVAEKVGSEPVKYVANIYKYYVAYTLEGEYRRGTQEILDEIRGAP